MTIAAVASIVLSGSASGHVGDLIDTLDVSERDGSAAVLGTFGLLLPAGDDALDWVCHEVVTAPFALTSPNYAVSDARLASWMPDLTQARDGIGVWTSADGCDWRPATGVDGRIVAEVSFAPDGTAWLATADPVDNGLFRATDGIAFAPVLEHAGRFLSVRADGAAIWAVSVEGPEQLTLWHSPDGVAFTSHPVPIPPGLNPPVRASVGVPHPSDPALAWIVLDPIGADQVLAVRAAGAVIELVWDAPDRVTDLDRAPDGTLYAVLNDRRVWRAPLDTPFADLTELLDGSGVDASTGALWVSHRTFVNGALRSRVDGATLTQGPEIIRGPLACPTGSEAARVCDPLWPQLAPRLVPRRDTADTGLPGPIDPVDPEPERRCGCVSGAGAPTTPAAATAGLLGLALWRRRTARAR